MMHVRCIGKAYNQKHKGVVNKCGSKIAFRALELNVATVSKEFYAMQAIEATMSAEFGRHSHERWTKDFYKYKESFESKIAEMFRDYLALIVLGELRHCTEYSDKGLSFDFMEFKDSMGRERCYIEKRAFTKESVLRCGIKMFNKFYNGWREAYGGQPWYDICKAGLMYGTEKNAVFIDHCFDLEHNGGNIFNKEGFLFCAYDNLIDFLDLKRSAMNTYRIIRHAQSKTLRNLIQRAFNLGILKYDCSCYFYISESEADFEFASPSSIFYTKFDENIYINQFYEENDRRMDNDNTYGLEDFLDLYHPYPWGDKDMLQEANIFNTGKKYENGENIHRYEERRDYYDAGNY